MKKICLLLFLYCLFFINPVFAENFVIKNLVAENIEAELEKIGFDI